MTRRILIVDDSLTVRADLEEAFAAKGMASIACATLAEARAALATEPVGLVILDVILPDGDGTDLLREIRARPDGATLPVLMLSSEAQVRDRIRGLATGSNDYVGKPYDRDYVIARASELLRAVPSEAAPALAPAVLVIDDSITFREQLSELLRAQGYRVSVAASGEEGLRSISLERPSAVVVDGVLPGIDGAGVVRKLRLDAAMRDTPCILLTGSNDYGAELRALDSGADAFVRKDEDIDMILARVTAVLRNAGRAARPQAVSLLSAKKILAVDDSVTYLHELADTLGGEGYDVILAQSGEEALEMVKVQSVDCVLLDRLMPGLGGTETCRRLKADAATRDIPLIMLTAMEDREAMIEGLSTGADDYVLKSSEFDVLKARVRAQLRRKQFEDESRRIRSELMNQELEAAEVRASRALMESRSELLAILEQKNVDLEALVSELRERQREIDHKNVQLEEASRLKSEFLSNMSHELRTPLNAIIGFSELLGGGIVGPMTTKQLTCVGHVRSSGKHLLALINDILDLSKIEAGKMTLQLECIEVDALLRGCVMIVQDSSKRTIAMSYEPSAGCEQLVVDQRKLRQMVYNLLSNAVKFSADGGQVRLSVHKAHRAVLRRDAPSDMVSRILPLPPGPYEEFMEIRVSDGGAGIAEHELPRLFQSFRQLDASTTRRYEGTGLGLALVSRLAELHGGTAGVFSAPGRGAQFSVWLPIRSSVPDEAPGVPALGMARRALVIEDDGRAAELLRMHLESVGLQVHCAGDARSALAMAAQQVPDLILLDLLLPGASGWSVLEQIKRDPVLEGVPVVVVSADAEEYRAQALGAVTLLQKPVARQSLLDAVYALGLGNDKVLAPTVLLVEPAGGGVGMASALAGLNYQLLRAANGHDAQGAARQQRMDLVVIDMNLDGGGAFAVIDDLRAQEATARLPLLLLTSETMDEEDHKRFGGALVHILEKGNFTRQRFILEVSRVLLRRGDAA